ncbi:MAG TPA: RsiV family protein [Gammaproteobacteria bacterium]|nr:RsiV family protein [Gammaproteobacteria bacterium]
MKKLTALLLTTVFLMPCGFAESGGAPVVTLPASDENGVLAKAVSVDKTMQLVATTRHEEDAALPYQIDTVYPQIEGDNLSAFAQQFNHLVENRVNESVQQFKNYVKADMPHMQTLPDSLKHNSFKMDYTADVLKPGNATLISVRLSVEGMQAGRAHPYHVHETLNVDLSTGKELLLKDFFKPGVNYLTVFSKYASAKLNQKLQDKWMIKDGTAPLAKNYAKWNLNNQGILITFEEYQVAPYVDGAQEVVIPWSVLKNLIEPKAVIAACVKTPGGCDSQI